MHHSIGAVPHPPPPCGGGALAYPGAFDGPGIVTSQYCHFLSNKSSSAKTIHGLNYKVKKEMVDAWNERSLEQHRDIRNT